MPKYIKHLKLNDHANQLTVIISDTPRAGFRTGHAGQAVASCPGASITGWGWGGSTYFMKKLIVAFYIFWYSRVGWASTTPLLKAARGAPHV